MPAPVYSHQLDRTQPAQNGTHYHPYSKDDNIRIEDLQQPSVQLQGRDNYAHLQSMNDDLMACISNSEYTLSSIRRDMQNQARALGNKASVNPELNGTSSPQQLGLSRERLAVPQQQHHLDATMTRPTLVP